MELTYESNFKVHKPIGYEILGVVEYGIGASSEYPDGAYIYHKIKKISVTREEIETSKLNWGPYIERQLLRLSHDKVSPKVEIEPIKGTTVNFKADTDKEIETMLGLLREVYDVVEMGHLTDNKLSPYLGGPPKILNCDLRFKKSLANRIFGYLQSKDKIFRDIAFKRQNKWRKHNRKLYVD